MREARELPRDLSELELLLECTFVSLRRSSLSRCPLIMIQICSVHMWVRGAVFGEAISIETLGSIDLWPSYEQSVQLQTAQLIGALRQAIANRPNITTEQLEFPWFRSFGRTTINYISRLKSSSSTHIFEATAGGVEVVVKFTKRYCYSAHKICEGLQSAPKLLHHETVSISFIVCKCRSSVSDQHPVEITNNISCSVSGKWW